MTHKILLFFLTVKLLIPVLKILPLENIGQQPQVPTLSILIPFLILEIKVLNNVAYYYIDGTYLNQNNNITANRLYYIGGYNGTIIQEVETDANPGISTAP